MLLLAPVSVIARHEHVQIRMQNAPGGALLGSSSEEGSTTTWSVLLARSLTMRAILRCSPADTSLTPDYQSNPRVHTPEKPNEPKPRRCLRSAGSTTRDTARGNGDIASKGDKSLNI